MGGLYFLIILMAIISLQPGESRSLGEDCVNGCDHHRLRDWLIGRLEMEEQEDPIPADNPDAQFLHDIAEMAAKEIMMNEEDDDDDAEFWENLVEEDDGDGNNGHGPNNDDDEDDDDGNDEGGVNNGNHPLGGNWRPAPRPRPGPRPGPGPGPGHRPRPRPRPRPIPQKE